MNLIDVLAVVLVLFAAIAGYRSGALPQVGGILGAVGGAALSLALIPSATELIEDLDPIARAIVVLGGILGAVAVGEAIGSAAGAAAGRSIGRGVLSAIDRLVGVVVGVGQALLIIWLAGGLLALGPLPRISSQVQTSVAIRTLTEFLPPPGEIANDLGALLDASGLPDVFLGLERVPALPVDVPPDPRAEAIAAPALASTGRVSASACGATLSGTGFVIADHYLVTNAHVVAGSGRVVVTVDGERSPATVVSFDPNLDIAVLHAPEIGAAPLRWATRNPPRETEGAAIGFPDGGPQTVIPAAVTTSYRAVGRDIYGRGRVPREIIELRARIDRGDSGGPLVLEDGTVGGVVFAESRTDEEVGYALAPLPVAAAVRPALGRTQGVATGECAR